MTTRTKPFALTLIMVALTHLVVAFFLVMEAANAQTPQLENTPRRRAAAQATSHKLLREGTRLLDAAGHFSVQGDQVTFHRAEDGIKLGGLPNLNLWRIKQALASDPRQVDWVVTGMVTEFNGVNYILVERAVLKAKSNGGEEAATGSRAG